MNAPATPAAPRAGQGGARSTSPGGGPAMGEAENVLGKAYDLRLISRLWPFVRPNLRLAILTALLIPLTIAFELGQPYLFKLAIVDHIAVGKPAGLELIALGYVALVLLQSGSSYFEQWALQLLGQRSMHGLRLAIYRHVMSQRAAFFDRIPVGRLMTRMTNDIESINEMFASGVVTLFADVIRMVAIIAIMLSLDVTMTLMTFATFPLLLVLVNYARRAMRHSFREIRVRLAAMNAFAQEHLQGMRVIQLLGRAQLAGREYDEINAGHRDAYLESIRADAAMYALVEAIGILAVAAIAWWASARGVETSAIATVGLVAVFIEYINKFFIPVRDLSAKYAVMQGAMAATERITQLLDTCEFDGAVRPQDQATAAAEPASKPAAVAASAAASEPASKPAAAAASAAVPAVRFAGVHFSYGKEPVLRGIDLDMAAGTTVAVVGATGSGKSTLIKLLTRLYDHDGGKIELAGVDIRSLPLEELRRRVTVVSQDVMMFGGTLAENISLGLDVPRETLLEAARRVGLDRALERRGTTLDKGLDELVAERGTNFSAGERQLIAFARAMVRNPEILVLDEATAHVDPEAEELIERGVAALMQGRTTLVIAHRLTTIRHSDQIVVVNRGKVVERGTHDELVAAGGIYAALERTFRRAT
ncbi:MAG: ABC transporter ATP-binding protein [Myxococcales bacterium]|nr:ABC transporter ATP-binding protein [Myxococcales bacterium]